MAAARRNPHAEPRRRLLNSRVAHAGETHDLGRISLPALGNSTRHAVPPLSLLRTTIRRPQRVRIDLRLFQANHGGQAGC